MKEMICPAKSKLEKRRDREKGERKGIKTERG